MRMMNNWYRKMMSAVTVAVLGGVITLVAEGQDLKPEGEFVAFGFSTVELGKEWDLLQLIENLQDAGIKQVELAVDQANGVAVGLSADDRNAVREQFQDAELEVLGLKVEIGFTKMDAASVATFTEALKQQLRLSHDIGGSGVRIQLKDLESDEARLLAVAKSLSGLGEYAVGFGQEIRVEVIAGQGNTAALVRLLKEVDHDQVKAAFVVGSAALSGPGLKEELKLLKPYLGTMIVVGLQTEGDAEAYDALTHWLVEVDFNGVVTLSSAAENGDKASAIGRQKVLWDQRMLKARRR